MCGIAGYVGRGDKQALKSMTDALAHRGPDDEGFYIRNRVGLGHRRLSIIDLKGGHQPIGNEDESIQIVFNGEIYNFQELHKDLESKGHVFKTKSDTETIVHLYEEEGESCVKKLQGMFAFAIWDERTEKLMLAKDRMGKKPLYYGIWNGVLVFGSEMRALLRHPLARKEINLRSLQKFLAYEYVPSPNTMLQNIWKLPAGHTAVWQRGQLRLSKYWEMSLDETPIDEPTAINKLDSLLDEAVRIRLVADVPLGVFLSGGLDSSTVAYYAAQHKPNLQTFSIGFDDPSFDESVYARHTAQFLGTNHHEMTVRSQDVLELVDRLPELSDEPMADASFFPTYILSKFTRQNVTVALSGDGGDELFFGYPTFRAHRAASMYLKLPKAVRRSLFKPIIQGLPVSFRNFSFDFVAKKFIQGIEEHPAIRNQIWLGSFLADEITEILTKEEKNDISQEAIFEDITKEFGKIAHYPLLSQVDYFYLTQYLHDDILVKADRASMAASLEVRSPLLDQKIVEFALQLPENLKLRGLTSKYILKKLMRGRLPNNIVNRKKKGFGIPLSRWFAGDLYETTKNIFQTPDPYFNTNALLRLLEQHKTRHRDNRKKLFTILVVKLWLKRYVR